MKNNLTFKDISKRMKYALALSIGLLLVLLIAVFVNMCNNNINLKKESTVLGLIQNIEAVQFNTEHLKHVKEVYLKSSDENYLNESAAVIQKIKENKNNLLDNSIKNNYRKEDILLLATTAGRTITTVNKILDGKKYQEYNLSEISFHDSIANNQIDSVIKLAANLEKEAINILQITKAQQQRNNNKQLVLVVLLGTIFFSSLTFAYLYVKRDIEKAKNLNKLLLYNSALLKNIYDAIIITDNNLIITDFNVHAENLYGYTVEEVKGKSLLSLFKNHEEGDINLDDPIFVNDIWKGEEMHVNKVSTPINVEVSKMPIKGNVNTKRGYVYLVRNITERIQLQKDLKALSENLQEQVNLKVSELNFFFERIVDPIIALDNDWNYTYLNRSALLLLGQTESEIIGKNIWEKFPKLIDEPFYETLQLAKKTQQPQRCELYYSAEDKWFNDLIYPSENGISIYYQDITSKKKAEIELANEQEQRLNAEAKFRGLVERSMVGVYIRKGKKLIYVNPRFVEIFGYTEAELYNDFDITNLIAESDRDFIIKNLEANAINNITSHNYEFSGLHKTGKIIYAEVFGSLTKFNGEDVTIGPVLDISERQAVSKNLLVADEALKISNERFELVAKATNDAIWDWDIINDALSGNFRFNKMLGIKEHTILKFENFFERVHEDDRENLLKNFKHTIKEKISVLTEEFRFKDTYGNYKFIYDRGYILYKNGMAYRMLGAMQDITALKEIEKKLTVEKDLSDSIINSMPGIFFLFNKEGKYLRWNKNFEIVSGYTPAEIKLLHPLQFVSDSEAKIIQDKIEKVFINGSDTVETLLRCKDEKIIPFYFTGMQILYENQECLMGIGIDISEKIQSQKELFESEKKFRTLVQQASDGIIITDEDGNFIEVNETAATLTGYKKEELDNMNTDDIFFEEGGVKIPLRYNAMASGAVEISEHFIRRKDGKMINVEVSAKQLYDGRFQRILRDITERIQVEEALKASEKKYRLLFNDNPLPMWINSQDDSNFIDVNNAALISYGYSKKEFFKMKLADLDSLGNSLKKHLPKEKADSLKMQSVFEHVKKDGRKIKVNILTHDIIFEGKPAILSLANDITAKFEAEENLQKSNEALRDLASHIETIRENERSHMAREIHDELGQQLTGLKMDISWLNRKVNSQDEAVKEKMKDAIALIDKTVITVRRIATELRPSILDDLGLIAAMEWQSEEFEKRSEIKSIFSSNVSQLTINTDVATAVFRIFQESLTNVLRHSQATEVISFFRLENNIITLFIEDNGIGFEENDIKNKKTLGLLGMKERIQLIHGKYEINGNSGKGTSVIITVPLK